MREKLFRGAFLQRLGLSAILLCVFEHGGPAAAETQTFASRLILIGGGKRPPAALQSWVEGARKRTSPEKLGAIPWASAEPEETLKAFREEIRIWTTAEVQSPPLTPGTSGFTQEELQQTLSWLGSLDGLYFTGGDQNRVIDLFERHPQLAEVIRQRFEKGELVVAGTSAGTAIQGRKVFTGAEDLTLIDPNALSLRPGLGLLPEAIVDQHFVRRQRHNRMLSAMISSGPREILGIAVDEDTALLIAFLSTGREERLGKVVGRGQVILFNTPSSVSPRKVELEIAFPGECLKWFAGLAQSSEVTCGSALGDTSPTGRSARK